MSRPSANFLDKVERWVMAGVPIEKMAMKPEQRFRAKLAYEAYQIWLQDKQIKPTDIMRRLANREYPIILKKAADGDELAQSYVDAMNIRPGVSRTFTEIANDVAVLNHLVSRFNVPTDDIEKAKVQDASDWLIRTGMDKGDSRSVKSGIDTKMMLYDNFRQKETAADQISVAQINITGDVSIVKRDRQNYDPKYIESMRRKYGLSKSDVIEMVQGADGAFTPFLLDGEEDEAPDIFIENEK